MIKKRVIIDTGPLVAFFNKNDTYHEWANTQFALLTPPFITCESVISETCFILQRFSGGTENVIQLIERELIIMPFNLQEEIHTINALMKKYMDIPMSLADGCLVRLAEKISNSVVCTLDSDFHVYRKNKRDKIPLIIPDK